MGKMVAFPGSKSLGSGIDTPGGGDNSGGMEARVARLESDVAHIQRDTTEIKIDLRDLRKDVRQLVYFLIGGFIVLLGMMATGYVRLDDRIETRASRIETKIDKLIERLPAPSQQPKQ